jgi:aminoglycoside 3-N-acetyltransferase
VASRTKSYQGTVGHAEARLMQSRDIVDVVTGKLRDNETVFLHPYGIDEECDEARASIPT